MSDNSAIAAAIAARFLTATTPAGQDPLVECTEQLPVGIASCPSLFVFPPDEPNIELAMSTRIKVQTYPVRLYLYPVPYDGPEITKVYGWQTALQDVILGQTQLGLAGVVASARMTSQVVRDISFNDRFYLGLDMVVTVKVSEPVQPVA